MLRPLGSQKRARPEDSELSTVMRGLRDMNLSKLVSMNSDLGVFCQHIARVPPLWLCMVNQGLRERGLLLQLLFHLQKQNLWDWSAAVSRRPDSTTWDPRHEKGVKVASSSVLPRIFRPCWFWQGFEISHFSHSERFPFHFLGRALGMGMASPNRETEF